MGSSLTNGQSLADLKRARWKKGITKQGSTMKSSVEAKVAAAVGAVFMALTVGVIAQGHSEGQTGEPGNYDPMNNSRVDTHMSQGDYDSSPQPPL